jgi:hypothetical protein
MNENESNYRWPSSFGVSLRVVYKYFALLQLVLLFDTDMLIEAFSYDNTAFTIEGYHCIYQMIRLRTLAGISAEVLDISCTKLRAYA